ncbi:hypothetical protein HK100_011247 [Physocladia obscura]|uniref:Aminoglycoside phosphotransferase domain-containing protein n=1 Tax=Physocladia obscura TaxID=109957 RepID=A0AAD5T3D7_9FUNG|nr:hypothetical protein HK100_011247 [Physocladia obscura]
MSGADTTGTTNVRAGMQIDGERLASYLAAHFKSTSQAVEFKPPLQIKQFKFGQSNPTYFISDAKYDVSAHGNKFVLRKKPPGQLISKTAHAVEREFRVINALYSNSIMPVPRVYLLCEDHLVIGTPFYVMQFLNGRIFADNRLTDLNATQRKDCYNACMDTLARLHTAPIAKIGLANFSRTPAGFYTRQMATLTVTTNQQHASNPTIVPAIPRVADMLAWFARNSIADEAPAVIHGDFKLDNMVFDPIESKIIGVLDWEMSTLGHPLSDLANFLLPWYTPHTFTELPGGVGFKDEVRPLPVPEAQDLIEEYCKRSGRAYPIPRFEFCIAFSFFRLLVIMQGVAARAARKQASSANVIQVDEKLMRKYSNLVLDIVDAGDLDASKL